MSINFEYLKSVKNSPPINDFYESCKIFWVWMTTLLVFLKLNDIVLYNEEEIFLDTKKCHCLWVGCFQGLDNHMDWWLLWGFL